MLVTEHSLRQVEQCSWEPVFEWLKGGRQRDYRTCIEQQQSMHET